MWTRPAERPVVLIADDDEDARRILEDALAPCGYVTLTVASGDVALLLARSIRPALVVSELYLAAGGHPCLVYALRGDARLRHTPLVAHTAFASPADAEWAARAPVDAFLRKPTPPPQLAAVVARLAGLPPGRRGARR